MRNAHAEPLLFAPKPAHNRTRTSRAAAADVADRAPTCRDRLLAYLERCGNGATAEEASSDTGIRLDTVKARIHDLGQMGKVVALFETATTSSGSQALRFITPENVRGRELEPWPIRRKNWRQEAIDQERRAIDAERRIEELERRLSARTESAA